MLAVNLQLLLQLLGLCQSDIWSINHTEEQVHHVSDKRKCLEFCNYLVTDTEDNRRLPQLIFLVMNQCFVLV